MRTLLVTGGIGSGKSTVCRMLEALGIPVYDCDSRAKALYATDASMVSRLEALLGCPLRRPDGTVDLGKLSRKVFSDAGARRMVEGVVHPALRDDFLAWRDARVGEGRGCVAFESAIALSCPLFARLADEVLVVTAPEALRGERVSRRDGLSALDIRRRMEAQLPVEGGEDVPLLEGRKVTVLSNDGTEADLQAQVQAFFSYLCPNVQQGHGDY